MTAIAKIVEKSQMPIGIFAATVGQAAAQSAPTLAIMLFAVVMSW